MITSPLLRLALGAASLGFCSAPGEAADASAPTPAPTAAQAEVEALALPRQVDQTGDSALRFTSLFRPFTTDQATLSPDGRFLAYSLREESSLFVLVVEVAHPETARAKVLVATDNTSSPALTDLSENIPASIRWMKWTSPTRVVVETNTNHPIGVLTDMPVGDGDTKEVVIQNFPGSILAFDADGANAKILVTPRDVPERPKDPDFIVPERHAPLVGQAGGGWRPDLPIPDVGEVIDPYAPPAPFDPWVAALAGDVDPNAPPRTPHPRSPRVLDLVAGRDDQVYVGAGTAREYQVYRLNSVTGKMEYHYDEKVGQDYALLLDRQGKARVGVPATVRFPYPHEYQLERYGGFSRWKPFNRLFADAGLSGFSIAPENLSGSRSVPLGFDEDPSVLYYASNVGRDTFGVYGFDTEKGQRTGFVAENATYDLVLPPVVGFVEPSPLVIDRFTHQLVGVRYDARRRTAAWLRPELGEVQKFLESRFQGHAVELLEWSADGKRFLLLVRGPADPGSFYVFDRADGRLQLFAQRAPWLDANRLHPTFDFATKGPEGVTISGDITMPREIRRKPVPMIVICPPEPWMRSRSEYRTEVQALASMGFAVVQINARGTWGFGSKQRDLVRDGWEEKRVEDIIAACDYLSRTVVVDLKRVALYGERRGGWLALRALQLRPERFRSAVVVEPTIDPINWSEQTEYTEADPTRGLAVQLLGGIEHLRAVSLLRSPEKITKAVLALSFPGPRGGERANEYLTTRRFIHAVEKAGTPAELVELDEDYVARLPKARSRAMREIETFLNASVYDFGVKMGDLKEMK